VSCIFKWIKIVVSCSPKYILKSAHNEETANQPHLIHIAKGWTYSQRLINILKGIRAKSNLFPGQPELRNVTFLPLTDEIHGIVGEQL